MSWEEDEVTVLVKAAPNWSKKYKQYEICTAGISKRQGWLRLYPFPEREMLKKDVHVWDIIRLEMTKTTEDPRQESRKIKIESITTIGRVENREEKKNLLSKLAEPSLEGPLSQRRSLAIIKPRIEGFSIVKRKPQAKQLTLEGRFIKLHPYGDVGLYYEWSCPSPCRYCKGKHHHMACFDWGANILYTRYEDEKEAKTKTTQKCLYEMKYDNDTWFALGTHRLRPFKRWMIVGLLYMRKEEKLKK